MYLTISMSSSITCRSRNSQKSTVRVASFEILELQSHHLYHSGKCYGYWDFYPHLYHIFILSLITPSHFKQHICRFLLLQDHRIAFRTFIMHQQTQNTLTFFPKVDLQTPLPLLYYLLFWDTLLYIYQIYPRVSDRSMSRNDGVPAILLQKWASATVAEFESHLPNAVTPSSIQFRKVPDTLDTLGTNCRHFKNSKHSI